MGGSPDYHQLKPTVIGTPSILANLNKWYIR